MSSPASVFRPDPSARAASEPDTSLIDIIALLWRHRYLLLIAVLLGLIAGTLVAFGHARRYEATVVLSVSQPKLVEDRQLNTIVANFRPLLENQALAAEVIGRFKLQTDGRPMTPFEFWRDVGSVEEIRTTNLFRLSIRLGDPKLSATVANDLATRAIALAQRVSREETIRARDSIKEQVDEARRRLDAADQRLRAFKEQFQIELLRKDADTALSQRGDLQQLQVTIAAERARLDRVEKELSTRTRTDTVTRAVDGDPALLESARQRTDSSGQLLGLTMKQELPNPVYDRLDEEVAETRSNLAGLEKQALELGAQRGLDKSALSQLSRLYEREAEMERLRIELEIGQKSYVESSTKFENARLMVASQSAQFIVIDAAIPSDREVPQPYARNGVIGGLLAGAAAVFLLIAIRAVQIAVLRSEASG